MKNKFIFLMKYGNVLVIFTLIAIVIANSIVSNFSQELIFEATDEIPFNNVGLLLGTSKFLDNGEENLYYKNRIDAAIELFKSKKIKFILVSGDNGIKSYNEPHDIKTDLIARGIPESKIFSDYAGFCTFDSIIRSDKIFGQKKITVISQPFHNERAIYIARHKNLEAIGFNAKDVSFRYGFKTRMRERLARVKMFGDLIFNAKPKFLGDKIIIE